MYCVSCVYTTEGVCITHATIGYPKHTCLQDEMSCLPLPDLVELKPLCTCHKAGLQLEGLVCTQSQVLIEFLSFPLVAHYNQYECECSAGKTDSHGSSNNACMAW